jgi:TPR repeat protein
MVALGDLYRNGIHVDADLAQAFTWYAKGADAGHPTAMAQVGAMYGDGKGTAKDLDRAFAWTERAAREGVAEAMLNLAAMYRDGLGTDPNHAEAYFWARAGAEKSPEPMREGAERFAARIGEHVTFQRRLAIQKRASDFVLTQVAD